MGQQLQSSAVQRANERNRENRFWQPTFSFNPSLSGDRHLQGLMRSLNSVITKGKKKSNTHHRRICVTC